VATQSQSNKGARVMNEHIELVKKWLADNDSVTKQDMEALAADAAAHAAAAAAYADGVADWVKRYDEFKEQK
jgi:hypothetical protein